MKLLSPCYREGIGRCVVSGGTGTYFTASTSVSPSQDY